MKPAKRTQLLRIMASTAVNACVYAAVVTLRTALFAADGGLSALMMFLFTAILANAAARLLMGGAPGFIARFTNTRPARFMAFMLNIKNSSSFASVAVAWMIIIMPMIMTLLIFTQKGVLRVLFELLPVSIVYIVSLNHTRLDSFQIMSNQTVYTGFFVLAICLEASLLIGRLSYLRLWIFAAVYLFMFAYLIIKNQEDIDSNIYSKKHIEKSILPKNLRKVNVVTVCVVFLAILLLFNLKTIVITLLDWSARFIFLIVRAIAWLMERILPGAELVKEGGGHEEAGFPELIAEPPSPVGNLLFNILSNFMVLYLAYKVLFHFVKWLPAFFRKIAGFIRRIFTLRKVEDTAEESDFVDETETIKPVLDTGAKRKAAKSAVRSIKDLKRERDPVKRIRLMYSIILRMLPNIGITPGRSDTTMEIIKKVSGQNTVSEELRPLTQVYNQVRYGDRKPDGETMTDADTHFDKAINVMGKTSL